MGLIRKAMSVGTFGVVRYRVDPARQTRNAVRVQVVQNAIQNRRQNRTQVEDPQWAVMAAPAEDEQWRLYRIAFAAWEAEQWRLYRIALAEWEAQQLANTPPPAGPQIAKDK